MALDTEAKIVDRTSQILEDTSNAVFADAAQIQPQLQDCLSEISEVMPLEVWHIKNVTSSHKLGEALNNQTGRWIDVSDISNLRSIKEIYYPANQYPLQKVPFTQFFNTVYLNISSRPTPGEQNDALGDTQVLTGTVTFTAASNAVTGSGTAFTSELEVGWYISPSDSTNWYRVASISSDTALKLSINVATADNGADDEDETRYWYEQAILVCRKNHYIEATQTDLAGAIDNSGGYAEDTYIIHVDTLGTGTMPKDMFFTIAGTRGVYRIVKEATITSAECDIQIEPRLEERAEDDAVVTFYGTSLTSELAEVICNLTAGRVASNWVGDARTAHDNVVTAYGLGNASIDKIATVTALINTQADSMVTAASADFATAITTIEKAEASLNTDAEAALDKLSGDIEVTLGEDAATLIAIINEASTEIDKVTTASTGYLALAKAAYDANADEIEVALDGIATALTEAETHRDAGVAYANVVPIWDSPDQSLYTASSQALAKSSAYSREVQGRLAETTIYNPLITAALNSAKAFLLEARTKMAVESQLIQESAVEARERVRLALGSLNEAKTYISADAQKVANLGRALMGYTGELNGDLAEARGYFQEATLSLRKASTQISDTMKWADWKIRDSLARLYRMQPSVVLSSAPTRF